MVTLGAPGLSLPADESDPVEKCQRATCSGPALSSWLSAAHPQLASSATSPGALATVTRLGARGPLAAATPPTEPIGATPR
jgi:hypothetical protein